MKNVKSDTKYIIKRILIGVGIAIILFNLKKCNVYAEDINKYVYFTNRSGGPTSNRFWVQDSRMSSTSISGVGTIYLSNDKFSYNSYINNEIKYNFGQDLGTSSTATDQTIWTTFRFYYNNVEYAIFNTFNPNGNNYNNLSNGNRKIMFSHFDGTVYNSGVWYLWIVPVDTTEESISSLSTSLRYQLASTYLFATSLSDSPICNVWTSCQNTTSFSYNNTNYYNTYFSTANFRTEMIDFDNITILENSNNWYTLSNQSLEPDTDPLANYTKVDLTGYQAVLLVPKNYQTMLSDSSHTNESPPGTFRTYLDLEYYSQECVRGTLINVENVQDIMLNNIGVGTGNIAESVTGTCYQEPTQTIMSYEFDQYSGLKARGLLVYNGSQDWQSGFGTETPFFGTSYVWYNPDLYNAYLVESFDNFNQTISYKDYSGEDQEVTIESLPTFTESMENAIENVDSPTPTEVNKQKLQAIFQFLKSPFSFLNKLNTTSCTPIDLPFPRSNQNIHLECLSSSVYDRYLPTALKSIIIIIINGLLFYRCTLSNIDIFTDILDPEDNKLEAVQL